MRESFESFTTQEQIAKEYLALHEEYQKISKEYQNTLRVCDNLRDEEIDPKGVEKMEEELKSLAEKMGQINGQKEMLFSQLTPDSKEKYLKPKSE